MPVATPEELAGLAARLRPVLVEAARRGETVTYNELAQRAGVEPPYTIHKTTLALEALARADHAAGRPLVAALAVGKTGAPGAGFFEVLSGLDRYHGPERGPDAREHHARELEAAIAYWGEANGGTPFDDTSE